MMFRFVHRLKKKHGAVLFAVVAIMALLIAMASAAYYTARSSYNTVVSNYDFSQLYVSTISAAGMVKDAVMNSASTTGSQADIAGSKKANMFDALHTKIMALTTGANDTLTIKTDNISDNIDYKNSSAEAIEKTVFKRIRSGGFESAIPGVLDALTVKVQILEDKPIDLDTTPIDTEYNIDGTIKKQTFKALYNCTYRVSTTAFYRDNTIRVEDLICVDRWREFDKDPGTEGYYIPVHQDEKWEIIEIKPGNGAIFNTFFTATAQVLNPDGSVGQSPNAVVINTDLISDDAYFESVRTYIGQDGKNRAGKFQGGVTTTGSLILQKAECNITGNDNDWFIGGDLVFSSNAQTLNLDQSSLYVKKDLILNNYSNITADTIYVNGDLYLVHNGQLSAKRVYVNGNIYMSAEDGAADNKPGEPHGTDIFDDHGNGEPKLNQNKDSNPSNITGGTNKDNGEGVFINGKAGSEGVNISVNGTSVTPGKGGSISGSSSGSVGTFKPQDVMLNYHVTTQDEAADQYKSEQKTESANNAMNSMYGTLANSKYGSITSPDSAYDNVVTIDFSKLEEVKDGEGNVTGYKCEFPIGSTGKKVIIEKGPGQQDEVTVTIPYVKEGISIDMPGDKMSGGNMNGNTDVTFKIAEDQSATDDAMPIVLLPNTSSPTIIHHEWWDETIIDTSKPDDAFSWKGDNYTSGNSVTKVIAAGGGNIIFEAANYTGTGDSKEYYPYKDNAEKAIKKTDLTVTEYLTGKKIIVGTEAQLAKTSNGELSGTNAQSMVDASSKPIPGYENHIMFVSNANGTKGLKITDFQSTLCAYIYAPNVIMDAPKVEDRVPIYGGMIVSTYFTDEGNYIYAQPTPSQISNMTSAMAGDVGVGGDPTEVKKKIQDAFDDKTWVPGKPGFESSIKDSEKMPLYWEEYGSNYVG